jgi:DoxX-like protein
METTASALPYPATAAAPQRRARWAGRLVSGLPVAFLIFDSVIKLVKIGPVTESMAQLGYPDHLTRGIALLEICCLAIYLVPRWAALGATLLTGYLGAAVATHLRVGDPMGSHTLFPIYVATMLWAGLWLRDARVRALVKGGAR